MKKVKISQLRAGLREYLREVRRGREIIVTDGETPIARIVPYTQPEPSLKIRPAAGKYRSLRKVPLPPSLDLNLDIGDLLREERKDRF